MKIHQILSCLGSIAILFSCGKTTTLDNRHLRIEVNNNLETKISSLFPDSKPLMDQFLASEYLSCKNFDAIQFDQQNLIAIPLSDLRGTGTKRIFKGVFKLDEYQIEKVLEIAIYDSFPDMAMFNVSYINTGKRDIQVKKWVNNSYNILKTGDKPSFWSFQGSSTNERKDWMLPVDSSFSQENYMGMNNTDYGGGIPLVDIWRKDAGIAVGHTDLVPRLVSLPVEKDKYEEWVNIAVEYSFEHPLDFNSGDTLKTYPTFVQVHKGDCFSPLETWSKYMQASGIHLRPVEPAAYEAVWCSWGYEEHFTIDEIIGTLPKVKELGLKWIDIDHGYQQGEGDWDVNPDKFPKGNADMRKLVDQIHAMGFKAKLWWSPLAVDPGSNLLKKNPDILLLNSDGSPQWITFWDSYYMSPVYYKTIQHTKEVIKMFLNEWDYDGLKMDGMHLNCVPPDYNPEHELKYPEQACEQLPGFFKMIYETAREIKPHAVLQNCPCGDAMSFYNMAWTNQTVASDPTSSWQIRLKGKTYKALLGKIAYYGDHVELSDGANDFASQIGIGAVIGTRFTWPKDNPFAKEGKFLLTPEREKVWKKWIDIYNQKMLSKEKYLGELYDIGYDKPETHVIQKGDTLFYAFYSPNWNGNIEIRGLGKGNYRLFDYVNDKELGTISNDNPFLDIAFKQNLLIEAIKTENKILKK